uniref:C-type lectin domain-containing protein n=1 Tax=Syphacia muris TaxID=451379 RepID=A0A0N5AE23_9BILA
MFYGAPETVGTLSYKWFDDTDVNISDWSSTKLPQFSVNPICIQFSANTLIGSSCEQQTSLVCQHHFKIIVLGDLFLSDSQNCREGWTEYNENCYLYVNSPSYYDLALRYCITDYASLVSLTSFDELNFLTGLTLQNDFWIELPFKEIWSNKSSTDQKIGFMLKNASQHCPSTKSVYFLYHFGDTASENGLKCIEDPVKALSFVCKYKKGVDYRQPVTENWQYKSKLVLPNTTVIIQKPEQQVTISVIISLWSS